MREVAREELLDIREQEWRPRLRGISLVAEAEIPAAHRTQAASALGALYSRNKYRLGSGVGILRKWPACLVAAMTGVAVTGYEQGSYWPALWKATGCAGSQGDWQIWGDEFANAVERLGLPTFQGLGLRYLRPILMHSGVPAYCLGDFFRLLAERRLQDPGLDADSFLAWATAPGRRLRLAQLDKPAQRFLRDGGEYAHDVVDRTLDLMERLAEPDPDLDGVGLPAYMIQAARDEVANGRLSLAGARRAATRGGGTRMARQARPRIALDPYGAGVRVLLPAVGDMPDGIARWRVTADGVTGTVQSRAMWVGAAEAAPETSYPLSRPVRTVLVALAGREDLTAELRVVEQDDPVLFFAEDGRRLPGTVSLPRAQVWIMCPADQGLEFAGQAGPVAESPVPFGWDGWRLVRVSLQDVQAVGLRGGRAHQVEFGARPQLLCGEPVPGVTTPYGSPVYPLPPALLIPVTDAAITWHAEVRRVGDGALLVSRRIDAAGEFDIWHGVARPVLGAFDIIVRGPLGRGLRRTVIVAEGLSVSCQPRVRLLTATGLAQGRAALSTADNAVVSPKSLAFGPGERSHPVEYRTGTESEPLIVTPPHAALLCPGAGITTWTTSLLHLVTEDFAVAGRLLARLPGTSQDGQLDLELYVAGRRVQSIPASGQRSSGLAGFELGRAVDTIAAHGRAELVLNMDGSLMPVGYVRPRTLASGADLKDGMLILRDAAAVDGLTAGVYLGYAPWRPPAEVPVPATGIAVLPAGLANAGPLRVLVRVDDPWTVSIWPAWPDEGAFACLAPGTPPTEDLEEDALSRFVSGDAGLPPLRALGQLWLLVGLAAELVKLGARTDLAQLCTDELLRRPREALLALLSENMSNSDVVRALISTGLTAAPRDPAPWASAELPVLERLWAAFPAAAAVASSSSLASPEVVDLAMAHTGDSLGEMVAGRPDPDAVVGRFGPDAERMERLAPDQVEALWQAAAVVPRALLDTDTRAAAARQMFDARNTMPLRAAAKVVKTVTRAAELVIDESGCPGLCQAITARRPAGGKGGWLALPAMSIAMSIVARLAARGDIRCAALEREYRGKWANLALRAPDLVAIDLVRAEALVAGALNERPEETHD